MANKVIKGITIEIGGETTKLGKALDQVNTKSKNLQDELKQVNKLLKLDPGNVELLKQKQEILNQSIGETKNKLNTLKMAQSQVQEQFDKGEITAEQYRAFQREITETEKRLKSLTKQAESFGNTMSQKLEVAGSKVKAVGDKVTSAGKAFMPASAMATTALVGVTKTAVDFESAFAGVTKTVDGTDEQLAEIRQGLLDLSKVTSSSAIEIAGVAEAAGQLGVKTEDVLSFTKVMVELGDSTNLSAEEAATALAQLYNVTGESMDSVENFGSALVALGNNSATTERDIMNMATRIASSGTQVGLTSQEILGLSATLASVGLEAEGGGSAISTVITNIDKAVATNGKTLSTWAQTANMSVTEFKNLWEKDTMSAIQAVIKGMGDAKAGGENLNVLLDELNVSNIRQTDTMKRLASAGDLLNDELALSNKAWDENSALTNEAQKRYATTGAKLTQLKNTFTELATKLGDILLPIVKGLVDKLSGLVNWLTNLSPTTQKVILTITGLVAALGPALIIIGKIISSVGSIITVCGKIPGLLSKIPGFFTMIGTAFKTLMTLITSHPIIAIITAVIAVLVLLWNNCQPFREFIIGLGQKVAEVMTAIGGWFMSVWNDYIKPVWDQVQPYFQLLWEGIQQVFSVVVEVLGGYFSMAWENIKVVWDLVVGYFQMIWENIKLIFGVVGDILSGDFSGAWEKIKQIWNNVVGFFGKVWDGIKQIFANVGSFFSGIFSKAWEAIKNIFRPVGEFFGNIWNTIKEKFTNIGQKIGQAVSGAFKGAVNGVLSAVENVVNFPIRAINKLIDVINAVPGISLGHLNEFKLPRLAEGAYVTKPTLAEIGEGGEPEIVAPESKLKEIMAQTLKENNTRNAYTEALEKKLLTILNTYLPQIASTSQKEIILDDGTLVAKITPKIDKSLGNLYTRRNRGG